MRSLCQPTGARARARVGCSRADARACRYHFAESSTASVSVSIRVQTVCEVAAEAPWLLLHWLHTVGVYRQGDCVCHNTDHDSDAAEY